MFVEHLVRSFYGRIRDDTMLGPIFEERVGHRWDDHLATMIEFWSSLAFRTGRYGGKPHIAHQNLGLTPEHLIRWLALFDATVSETCTGPAAAFFRRQPADRSQHRAQRDSFSRQSALPATQPQSKSIVVG
jgi:hemoglobin